MSIKLTTGNSIPILGFGTFEVFDESAIKTLQKVLEEKKYLHIDTASAYGNEEAIGLVLQDLFNRKILNRNEVFITTKVSQVETHDIANALQRSLERLKLDYVDLFLIHWPYQVDKEGEGAKLIRIPLYQQWAEMEKLHAKGLTKSIGVSNFNFQLLNDLLSYAKVAPAVNQIELHPYLSQVDFVEWLKENKIVPIAYSPLASGVSNSSGILPLQDPTIKKIADKHGKSPAQVILAWHLTRGHVIIPKSAHYDRAVQNWQAVHIKLTTEELEEINKLNRNRRVCEPKQWGTYQPQIPLFQ